MDTIWRCFECVDYSCSLCIRLNGTNRPMYHGICNPQWAQFEGVLSVLIIPVHSISEWTELGTIWRCFECADYSRSLYIRVNRTNRSMCHSICNPQWTQFLHTICCAFFVKCPICVQHWFISNVRGGTDKSLARPTSYCCRMESIVSLERGVCSCAELQVFSCYRGWKEAC